MMRRFIRKGDILIAGMLVCIAVFIWLPAVLNSSGRLTAYIYEDGILKESILLSEDTASRTIEVHGGRILIEDGRIGYIEADCPDRTCMRSGMLSKAGQTSACVPNRTMIVIENKKADRDLPDAVTY